MVKDNSQTDQYWESRTLCSDENCIGVIGPDGRCKECGNTFEGDFSKVSVPAEEAVPSDDIEPDETELEETADASEKFGQGAGPSALDNEISRLEGEIVAKLQIQEILQRGIFSNTSGFSDYLVSFARQRIQGVWLTGFDITGAAEQMVLAGRTTNPELVPRYMQKLSSEKTLSGIEFRTFQMNRPEPDTKNPESMFVEFQARTANPG